MLKYKFRLSSNDIKEDELEWSERYLSSDLSLISGVTSTRYNLGIYSSVVVKNDRYDIQSRYSISSKTVTRQGYIVIKNKPYDILSGTLLTYKTDLFNGNGDEVQFIDDDDNINYQCVFINGKYFYRIDTAEHGNCFMVTDFLVEQGGRPIEKTAYLNNIVGNQLLVDTIYWIEDGLVNIDGETYIYNKDEGSNGTLRYFENGAPLEKDDIYPAATSIEMHPYDKKDYEDVCKFEVMSNEYSHCLFKSITFANYYYYVFFKDNYLKIRETTSDDTLFVGIPNGCDSPMFVCEIPNYILDPYERKEEHLTPNLYPIMTDVNKVLTVEEANNLNIFSLQDLHKIHSYILIDDTMKDVAYDIQNSDNGQSIIVYLANNDDSNVKVNSEIVLCDLQESSTEEIVYKLTDFGGNSDDDGEFVLYNGIKYKVIENLCDRAAIPISALSESEEALSPKEKVDKGLCNEMVITYINGKVDGKDALVRFYNEDIPMKLFYNSDKGIWQLKQYGSVTVDNCEDGDVKVSDVTFDINPHDGIFVNGNSYMVKFNDAFSCNTVVINEGRRMLFKVADSMGGLTLICEPIVPNNLTREFESYIASVMSRYAVISQSNIGILVKDMVFGDEEITQENGWEYRYHQWGNIEESMIWLYKEKYRHSIIIPNGHILIPLNLDVNFANNVLQDDIVQDKFFRVEREKAINGIVDMEKDVYLPKYIGGYYGENGVAKTEEEDRHYSGSSTIFNPIYEINLNFHFRTRNLSNWKVNEAYDSADSLSGDTDNWFVTDFHPYKDMIEDDRGDELMDSSDLVGLLNFKYDDVFYQKSKLAKSFARLSLYDSVNPQTQSLMDMSTVFVDEHLLYKKLIDNSRKNINIFGFVKEPKFVYTTTNQRDISSGDVVYKISVSSEYLGINSGDTQQVIDDYKEHWKGVIFDNNKRLDSRLVIKNKYQTDTSSEGFYHYIFKEYSEDLHPKPIYMKVEFNHAGIGKTIPMCIPMKWEGQESEVGKYDYKGLKFKPNRVLNLSNSEDLDELKRGFPLSFVYAQSYIPFYAVYDFINKEYAYVIDERYLTSNNKKILHEKGILNIDLFEMKIMDEVDSTIDEGGNEYYSAKDPRKQKVGVINLNNKMFNEQFFNTKQQQ